MASGPNEVGKLEAGKAGRNWVSNFSKFAWFCAGFAWKGKVVSKRSRSVVHCLAAKLWRRRRFPVGVVLGVVTGFGVVLGVVLGVVTGFGVVLGVVTGFDVVLGVVLGDGE